MKKTILFWAVLAMCLAVCAEKKTPMGDEKMRGPRIDGGMVMTASMVMAQFVNKPQVISVDSVTFRMQPVEGGEFMMGIDAGQKDCGPAHRVILSSYYIGETEVTQALWKAVTGRNPAHFKGDNLPVESVTLAECHQFIEKLNKLTGRTFRLPTEAEWEYAARGGRMSRGTRYAGSDELSEVAWIDNVDRPQPVAQLKPNELGLYDMSGNVCEWCEDIYGDYSAEPQVNPKGASEGVYHPGRGGGWNRGGKFCLVYDRGNYRPEYASNAVGLRLVLENR